MISIPFVALSIWETAGLLTSRLGRFLFPFAPLRFPSDFITDQLEAL